jgi:hypothetical protein
VRHAAAALVIAIACSTTGCAERGDTIPRCDATLRVALIAQSVPDASYVPCIAELPTGWSFEEAEINDAGTTIRLVSDRADRPVIVTLRPSCEIGDATLIAPSDESARTYQRIDSIDPRYAGAFIDLFPGGCIESSYDFERGPHVALITDLQRAIDILSRRQLGQVLERDLGIRLDP